MKAINYMKGLEIILKYDPEATVHSEHDQTWCGSTEDMTEEDHGKMENLGWFIDEDVDSWSCFT